MTAGDKNVSIVCDTGGYNMTSDTATLLAAPGEEPNPIGRALSLTPVAAISNGLRGLYRTTGNDILRGGPWQFALQVVTPDGGLFTSPWAQAYINPLL